MVAAEVGEVSGILCGCGLCHQGSVHHKDDWLEDQSTLDSSSNCH